MKKKIVRASSLLSNEHESYWSKDGIMDDLVLHHVFHGWDGSRAKSDIWGCWCFLTVNEHEVLHKHVNQLMDAYGNLVDVPEGLADDMDETLKHECQVRFVNLYGMDKFYEVFGKYEV